MPANNLAVMDDATAVGIHVEPITVIADVPGFAVGKFQSCGRHRFDREHGPILAAIPGDELLEADFFSIGEPQAERRRALDNPEGSSNETLFEEHAGAVFDGFATGIQIVNADRRGDRKFVDLGSGWERWRDREIGGFCAGNDLEGQLSGGFAVHVGFENPGSRRGAVGEGHFPIAGEARLACVVVETGHVGELPVRTTDGAFTVMLADDALPDEINDDFAIVGHVKRAAGFGHYEAAVALIAFGANDSADQTNLRSRRSNAARLLGEQWQRAGKQQGSESEELQFSSRKYR